MIAKLELTEAQKDVLLLLSWRWPRYAHRVSRGKHRGSARTYGTCMQLEARRLAKHTDKGWILTSDGEEVRRLVVAERRGVAGMVGTG